MPSTYDVFLSYASRDRQVVEELARRLKAEGLRPFLDKWHQVPGEPWQEAIEKALARSRTCAVFVGPGPLGPWQNEEMRNALDMRVRDDSRRVIPVLLPGASISVLPLFLARLTWVDFRAGFDDSHALGRLMCGIQGIPPEDGPEGSVLPPARPIMIGVPHRNPFFTGRETLLAQLHQELQTHGTSVLAQAAIHGLGGIGKTQTAIEYAHRFGKHFRFVLWAVAAEEAVLRTAYRSIARELQLVEAQADLDTAVRAVKAWLARENGWLLIFDNADDPALMRPYLPPVRAGGKVLLTSRAKSFVTVGIKEPLRVETLEPEDAVKFLIERTDNADAEAAAALAAELGCLPLALEQAAAYVETVGGSCAEYLARYRRQGVALFEKSKPSTDYPRTVATTWSLSFDAVREVSPASAELLTAAAFLVPDSVPIEIFTLGGSVLAGLLAKELKGAAEDPLVFWELLEPLERYSLVERLPDIAFKLHRLTQEVVKDSLGEEGKRAWAARVVQAMNAAYPWVEFETWKLCERLQPHARLASQLTRTHKLESAAAGRLFSMAGIFASVRGDHAGARLFGELSLEICEHVLGGDHINTLVSRSNLATTLQALGDLAEARKLLEQTLEIFERVVGHKHLVTLRLRNNLAETLRSLGDFASARKLHEQTVEVQLRELGGEHPDTLTTRNNLAETLNVLGDLAGARKIHEQNLEIRVRVLGSEHPDTLQSRINLAATLFTLNDLAGARQLNEENLEMCERVLGSEHHATLLSRINLALTLGALDDHAGAKKLNEENLEMCERVLGSEHSDTQGARTNLAKTLCALDDFAGARQLQEQTLEIQERVLGAGHPDTTLSTWNLLWTVRELNDSDAEAHLVDRLRWLLDSDEDSIPSAKQREIRQKLLDLLNPS